MCGYFVSVFQHHGDLPTLVRYMCVVSILSLHPVATVLKLRQNRSRLTSPSEYYAIEVTFRVARTGLHVNQVAMPEHRI